MVLRLEQNSGPAAARNAGLATARKLGVQTVAFMDADCLPEVCPLSKKFRGGGGRGGGGRSVPGISCYFISLRSVAC